MVAFDNSMVRTQILSRDHEGAPENKKRRERQEERLRQRERRGAEDQQSHELRPVRSGQSDAPKS